MKHETPETAHPGVFLRLELKKRNLTQKAFANLMELQPSHLSELVKGKRNVSEQLASKLEQTLGIPSSEWLEMQAKYDYELKSATLRGEEDFKANRELADYDLVYSMRTIFKWLGMLSEPVSKKLDFCKRQLHFGTPAEQERQSLGYFHKSEKTGLDARMIATWTVLAKYEAGRKPAPVASFSKERMDELASRLSAVFSENSYTLNRVERTLADYGVKFCVVPKVERASVDGFSFWSGDAPAIVVTRRFDRIDNLAFAVMHEVGHLKLHLVPGADGNVNLAPSDEDTPSREETQANAFAANALIPEAVWENAPETRPIPSLIQAKYQKWARQQGLNPWIVLGRVSHETGIYTFKSDVSRRVN